MPLELVAVHVYATPSYTFLWTAGSLRGKSAMWHGRYNVVVVLVVGVCVEVDGGSGLSMQTLWYEFFESLAFMFELNWMPSPPEKHPGGL